MQFLRIVRRLNFRRNFFLQQTKTVVRRSFVGTIGAGVAGLTIAYGVTGGLGALSAREARGSEVAVLKQYKKTDVKRTSEDPLTFWQVLRRFFHLSWIFFPVVFWAPLMLRNTLWEDPKGWYKLLRETLEKAGPVFIKWGQWGSTRYDLLPVALCDELNSLTQNSPAHSLEETYKILEASFGKQIHTVLRLEPEPVASGSIGQVYRGQLDEVGEVAVKVQHPNLHEVIRTDFTILEFFSRITDEVVTRLFSHCYRTNRMLKQFKGHVHEQLDFELEARNLERFIDNFANWPHISFPVPRCSTKEVLIESFEGGHSIIDYIRKKQEKDLDLHTKQRVVEGNIIRRFVKKITRRLASNSNSPRSNNNDVVESNKV